MTAPHLRSGHYSQERLGARAASAVPTHFLSRTKERPEDRRELWRMCREQAGMEERQPVVVGGTSDSG